MEQSAARPTPTRSYYPYPYPPPQPPPYTLQTHMPPPPHLQVPHLRPPPHINQPPPWQVQTQYHPWQTPQVQHNNIPPPPHIPKPPKHAPTPTAPQERICTLFIGKIDKTTPDDLLKKLLEQCGPIHQFRRPTIAGTNTPQTFGYCDFATGEGVARAMRLLPQVAVMPSTKLVLTVDAKTKSFLERYEKLRDSYLAAVSDAAKAAGTSESQLPPQSAASQDASTLEKLVELVDEWRCETTTSESRNTLEANAFLSSLGGSASAAGSTAESNSRKESIVQDKVSSQNHSSSRIERERRELDRLEEQRETELAEERRAREREVEFEEREMARERRESNCAMNIRGERRCESTSEWRKRMRSEREADAADRLKEEEEERASNSRTAEAANESRAVGTSASRVVEAIESGETKLATNATFTPPPTSSAVLVAAPVSSTDGHPSPPRDRPTFAPRLSVRGRGRGVRGSGRGLLKSVIGFSEDDTPKMRRLVPFHLSDEHQAAPNATAEHSSKHYTEAETPTATANIPSEREALYAYHVDWDSLANAGIIQRSIEPWVSKKMLELLGEEEPELIDMILGKLKSRCTAQNVEEELSQIFDDEAESFTCDLWRLLLLEIAESKK